MAANIEEIRKKVQTRIKDEARRVGLAEVVGDVDQAILSALAEYQNVRPRERVNKVAGNGGFDYALSGGSPVLTWADGFSEVLEVAYPYATTDQHLNVLLSDGYDVVRLDTGLFLRFWNSSPKTTEFFLARYTAPHTLDATSSSVPPSDDEALADLGAALSFEKLAAVYAQDTDATVQADVVDRPTKGDLYLRLAGALRARYEQKLEVGKAHGPANVVVNLDRRFTDQRRSQLFFHGRRGANA